MEAIFKPLRIKQRLLAFKEAFDNSMTFRDDNKKIIRFDNKFIIDREIEIIKNYYSDYIILCYERNDVEFYINLEVFFDENLYSLNSIKETLNSISYDWNDINYTTI